ncbi:hypothetical protein ACS8Y6_16695 [Salinisphaera sp. RV14]|uniref:hypothetical protein n=1 Tax=Salinisphaera sp. RV14 TaxID=3454140 RepID=UPI003F843D5E
MHRDDARHFQGRVFIQSARRCRAPLCTATATHFSFGYRFTPSGLLDNEPARSRRPRTEIDFSLSLDGDDGLDLDDHAQRQRSHADGGAGVKTGLAQDLGEQVGTAVAPLA